MVDLRALVAEMLQAAGLSFRDLSVVELNRSTPRSVHLGLLVFLDGAAVPNVMIKATADPIITEQLQAEFDNLKRLYASGSAELTAGLPRPLHLQRSGGWVVLAESALAGQRMKNLPPARYYRSGRFPLDLTRTVDWLLQLQRLAGEFPVGVQPIGEAAESYVGQFEVSSRLRDLLDEAVERLQPTEVPLSPWHGDFCTANLLIADPGQVGVIDWQDPLARSWPLSDLLHHLTSIWCAPYAKGGQARLRNYRTMFFEPHRHSRLVRRLVDRFLEGIGIDPGLKLPLAVASWLAYANRKSRQLETIGRSDAATGEHLPLVMVEGERCLNLELLAEHRDRFLEAG